MTSPPYKPFHSGDWHGLRASDFNLPAASLDEWLAKVNANPRWKYPSRTITAPDAQTPWFIKTFLHASDKDSLLNRLKWRLRPSRALHTWSISQALSEAGFCTPKILLAIRRRAWKPFGWPTDLLVMQPAQGQSLRETLLQKTSFRETLLNFVATELAHFHSAGFAHGDCIPGNLFLDDANGRLVFIDNDRTTRTHFWNRPPRIRRNLVQLGFHLLLENLADRNQIQAFLEQYAHAANWSPGKKKRELKGVWRWIDRRLAHQPK